MYPPKNNHYISYPLVLKVVITTVIAYLLVVGIGNVLIYRKGQENGYTRFVERIFPYPAAVVGREVIPLSRFRIETAALEANASKHALATTKLDIQALVVNKLINRSLYEQELKRQKIVISDQDIQKRLEEIYKEIGGEDKLVAFLNENYGKQLALRDFRLFIKQFLLEYAIQHQILSRATVRHILIAVPDNATPQQVDALKKKAEEVRAKIKTPDDFAAIAKDYSEDTNSRDKGGELGTTFRGSDQPVLSAEFEQAIFSLPINEISQPIRSPHGWHIVIVDKREGSVNASMKEYTETLRGKTRVKAFVP